MKETNRKKRKHSLVLIAIIIIGLLAGLFLVQQRHQVEEAQNQIENIVDYDAVLRASSFEKRSTADALKALKDAGVTGMAIYDRTLTKARDAGEILVYHGEDAAIMQFYGPHRSRVTPISYRRPVRKATSKKFTKIWFNA